MDSKKVTWIILGMLTISIGAYQTGYIDDKVMLAVFGALLTAYVGLIKQIGEDDRLFKELFQEFNKKYTGEMNNVLNNIKDDSDIISIEKEKIVIDYLNLCAEEYLWYKKGRLPKEIWEAWKNGIKVNLRKKAIRKIFDRENDTYEKEISYYGLAQELKK